MAGPHIAQVARALAHLRELEAQREDPDRVRAWAVRHFEQLNDLEQSLRGLAEPAQRSEIDLVAALREVAHARPGRELDAGLGALLRITDAQRGFIAVPAPGGGLSFLAARTFDALDVVSPEAQISRTILERAMHGVSTVLVEDAGADPRFDDTASVDRLALRAVLVVPLVVEGRPFGVLYLDNPIEAAAFTAQKRRAAETFAELISPTLARSVEARAVANGRQSAIERLQRRHDLCGFVFAAAESLHALRSTLSACTRAAPICFVGEPGAGKRLLAQVAHHNSPAGSGSLVELRCAEQGPTEQLDALVGRARGGSLLVHRVDALERHEQLRLARVLDGCDARVLVTTRTPLSPERFEHELLYRIHIVEVEVPPLRERVKDIDAIASRFLADRGHVLPPGALPLLEFRTWEGNVRELLSVLERALTRAGNDRLRRAHFVEAGLDRQVPAEDVGLKVAVREFRRRFVQRAMRDAGGDHQRAAAELGVHPKYLYKLLRDLAAE